MQTLSLAVLRLFKSSSQVVPYSNHKIKTLPVLEVVVLLQLIGSIPCLITSLVHCWTGVSQLRIPSNFRHNEKLRGTVKMEVVVGLDFPRSIKGMVFLAEGVRHSMKKNSRASSQIWLLWAPLDLQYCGRNCQYLQQWVCLGSRSASCGLLGNG